MIPAGQQQESSGSSKNDHAKKQDLLKELQLLRIKEQNLEREKSTHIYSRQGDLYSELVSFQQLEQSMAANRKANGVKMRQLLVKSKDMVRKFRRDLENASITPEFLEKLKVVMEEIENEISSVREQQKSEFDELAREERLLNQEVEALDRRFDMWLLPGNGAVASESAKTQRVTPSSRDITADLPPEVAAFEIFLQQTGGHRGGWDEYDHNTFMKYRNRHKGKLSFVNDLTSGPLPTRTEHEIREHEAWFQEYTRRNDLKKEVIQKWREKKEIERDQAVAKEEANGVKKTNVEKDDQEKREQIEREKQEQREQLNRWKVEKELKRAEEEEQRLKKHLEKQRLVELEKQRQIEIRKKVGDYKMLKEKEEEEVKREEFERQQMEVENRQRQATELISRFRDRDLEAVREKRDRERREKERLEREKQERLDKLRSQVGVTAERDPQRLLRMTEGWKERQKDTARDRSGPMLHIPHRAIPSWRQGLP